MAGFWYEANSELIDEDEVIHFNLMEDIRCMNERIAELEKMIVATFKEYNSTGHLSLKLCLRGGMLLDNNGR